MNRNIRLLATVFVIAFAMLFASSSNTRTSAVSVGSECGECMQAAAQAFNACMKGDVDSEKCKFSFERRRGVCRLFSCGPDDGTEPPIEPAEPEAPAEPEKP